MCFENVTSLNELKQEYRKMAFMLHPDMGGDAKAFAEMKNSYEDLFKKLKDQAFQEDPENNINWNTVNADELDDGYMKIIDLLIHLKGIEIELCGGWLWLSGSTREVKEQLKACGCYWAPKKQMWYWRPSYYQCRHNRHPHSMSYIRNKYGSQKVTVNKATEIEA